MRNLREDLRVPDAEADLYLVGLGIGGFDQRTVEADQVLRDAITILHLTAFDKELREITSGRVEDLSGLYFEEGTANEVYERMARYVADVTANLRGVGHVCFLTYGHPLFLVDSSWSLLQSTDLRVKALPASSFLDRVLVDLDVRFDRTCQLYEANALMVLRPNLDIRVPLMISQVGEVGSNLIAERGRKIEWVTPLFDFVSAIYPPDRRCDLVFSPYRSDMAPQVRSAVVDELPSLISSVHTGSTLFIHGQ